MTALPLSIDAYLNEVRAALGNADPALIQDALYDAEEYLRSEMAEHPELDEARVVERVAGSYGSPEEVASIYRDTESRVSSALRPPPPRQRESLIGRFFGVAVDPRTYGALFYMLLALATGIFYFTVAVAGLSISASLAILIIGVPFAILFLGMVRVLSLVEGRIVETMLGVRMPRRPLYANRGKPMLERIKELFVDPRTWSTLLYMVVMLPLGIVYFTVTVSFMSIGLAFTTAPILYLFADHRYVRLNVDEVNIGFAHLPPVLSLPLMFVVGVLITFGMLHLARGLGFVHGHLAKHLLVKSAQY